MLTVAALPIAVGRPCSSLPHRGHTRTMRLAPVSAPRISSPSSLSITRSGGRFGVMPSNVRSPSSLWGCDDLSTYPPSDELGQFVHGGRPTCWPLSIVTFTRHLHETTTVQSDICLSRAGTPGVLDWRDLRLTLISDGRGWLDVWAQVAPPPLLRALLRQGVVTGRPEERDMSVEETQGTIRE